jgi:putative nucleotidyltransferase with HDIG domain
MSPRNEIIKRTASITSIPAAALQAMRILQDHNAGMGELVQVISYDPGLTSNILKLANSSYFGCAKAISSLREAVVRLGSANIFKLVTASIANVALSGGIKCYNLKPGELWEHSIAVAVAAETFSEMKKSKESKLAFTAGLLHDIGKVVLGRFIDKTYFLKITERMKAGSSYVEAEAEVLGIDHAEAGAKLLESWNIPDHLALAVRWHHRPEMLPGDPVPAVVCACDSICLEADIGSRPESFKPKSDPALSEKLGIDGAVLEELVLRTRSSVDNIKDAFSKRD